MRALVTGGAGFIGSHVAESLLENGATVTVADNFSTGLMENLAAVASRVIVVRVDLAREDIAPILEAGRFDTIVHAAGNASIPASIADPRRDLGDNILSTQCLLEAVRRVSPRTAVLNISSATVYAEASEAPINEDDPKDPASPYGVSKLAAELYVRVYARLFGLKACSVRLFSVFGPRLRTQVVWDFMSRLAADPGELVIHGDGSERRNPTHVQNIADAIVLVAERGTMTGDVYNIGSRESVSIAQLARDVADAMGLTPDIRHSGRRSPGHSRAWVADVGRLEALGYRPAVSYRDGLAQTVAWFRSTQQADTE